MADLAPVFELSPYALGGARKETLLIEHLRDLSEHHRNLCKPYYKITGAFGFDGDKIKTLADFFMLPVQIFKRYELKSIGTGDLAKTLTSSGTTSSGVSKIFLDKQTTKFQTRALARIMGSYLGPKRLPMIIIDTEAVIKDRRLFSARGGGIIGLSNFGRDHFYLFDENMKIRRDELGVFLKKHRGEKIFLFGFTFMIWLHLVRELEAGNSSLHIEGATLVHSGGWKKLEAEKVDNAIFKQRLGRVTGITDIFNFYGMVEQMGSVYMECENGHFHASVFSEIIARDPYCHRVLRNGETGVIETISILPRSYPGHVILTEDLGCVHGVDDCGCGRMGTHFTISGRIPKAEARGCSDTYEAGA